MRIVAMVQAQSSMDVLNAKQAHELAFKQEQAHEKRIDMIMDVHVRAGSR
jgi:hypothetical protein